MPTNLEELRATVENFLTEENIPFRDRGHRISVRRGSSAVFVQFTTWADAHSMIELVVPVLTNIDESPGLLERLNSLNMTLYFGKAYWHDRGVWLAHNLLGDHIDRGELIAAVGVLGTVADKIDDELKAQFGGTRWIDT